MNSVKMYDDDVIHNLVIQVNPKGRNGRKVSVPKGESTKGTSGPQLSTPPTEGQRKDAKKDTNISRQSYQLPSNNSYAGKNSSTNIDSAKNLSANSNAGKNSSAYGNAGKNSSAYGNAGKNSSTNNYSGKNSSANNCSQAYKSQNNFDNRRVLVSRQRSFMKTPQNNHNFMQEVQLPLLNRGVSVQRQRSCVAELYGGHNRNTSSTMPAATACARVKPSMQLYRPPTRRVSDDSPNEENGFDSRPGLNINAKEFVSLSTSSPSFSGPNGATASAVLKYNKYTGGLHHSKSGGYLTGGVRGKENRNGGVPGTSPPLRVHFTDDTISYDPDDKVGMNQKSPIDGSYSGYAGGVVAITRSKSLGSAADLATEGTTVHPPSGIGGLMSSPSPLPGGDSFTSTTAANAIADMSPLTDDVTNKFQQLLQTPSHHLSARVVMEVVKELFNKIIQGTKYAEPAARYCIAAIESEQDGETFLETLLNTCQEYYQERGRLLRPPPTSSSIASRQPPPPASHTKWVAYMTFLHEIYTQVKRRHRTLVTSSAPGMLLLSLLAECCVVTLEDQVTGGASLTQTECLFFILTGVGRDIELHLPSVMTKVMSAARDGLFGSCKTPGVRKTLLQLIEMSAASWQLPAQAVMYYYPAVRGK